MPSNLASIGFEFADAEAFQVAMIELAGKVGEQIDCAAGSYALWRSPTGAQVWFHLGVFATGESDADIMGLTPFFEGQSEVALEIQACQQRAGDNAFEGCCKAWVCGADGAQVYPLQFDAVDFAAIPERALPYRGTWRLVGFVHELTAYKDDAAFAQASAADGEGIQLATRAFIPIGMFGTGETEGDAEPSSEALLTGHIVEHHELVNEVTGRHFHWLIVDSLEARFDLVAAPEAVSGPLTPGSAVKVMCCFFGRRVT